MTKEHIASLVEQLKGLKKYEWERIAQQVNLYFALKAAKLELDDSEELKKNLEVEFNLCRYSDAIVKTE